jgi:holliday junction DNA helicase RuvA
MIAKLSGRVDEIALDGAIIDVNGVGYWVAASARTLRRLGAVGEAASLWTDMWVSEDNIALYGFIDRLERDWFRLLTTVQGVGAKVALNLLSVLAPETLAGAIAAQDKTALCQADGVGPKLAARILNELREKAASFAFPAGAMGGGGVQEAKAAAPISAAIGGVLAADAVSALVNLGYKRLDAFTTVNAVLAKLGDGVSLSELIRLALKDLSA